MARRTGITSIQYFGRQLCRLIVKFTPIIQSLDGYTPAVGVALSAALAACQALEAELMELQEVGD